MTNSSLDTPSTNTGTGDLTFHVEGKQRKKLYISNRDAEFKIEQIPAGLYFIKMAKGGKPPKICDELFTSYATAEHTLIQYLRAGDRLGYAKYPGKKTNGKSES